MMKKLVFPILLLALALVSGFAQTPAAQDQDLKLLPPQTDGGRPLMQCLKERQSLREFSPEKLAPQVLSNLLWAGCGINRPDSGKRTAPSARNWQNIDVYAAMADGLFLYNAKDHSLTRILADDIRTATGSQPFVKDAPVNLIYVADLSKIPAGTVEDKRFNSAAHTGFISQNVYLYCASEKLATVVRGLVDRESLAKTMKLRPEQYIIFAQTVGYPKK